jgi:translation initiation factor 1
MPKKKLKSDGIVFSTDPEFIFPTEAAAPMETLPSGWQKLTLRLDRKQRAGKSVTLVQGFSGTADDLEALSKKLKAFCGTGGSAKDGEILIQGDQREKLANWFLKNGYVYTKKL